VWPVILQLGPLTIYSFGAMAALACIAAAAVTERELNRRGLPGDVAWSMSIWATFVGFLTSAVWYYAQEHFWQLLDQPFATVLASLQGLVEHFQTTPGNLLRRLASTLAGLSSGFVWYGGLIGGTLTVTWVIHRHRLPWLVVVDCTAPGLALAHAIGRIGCQLAGDGDWGTPSTVPWAMAYPNAIVGWPPHDPHGVPYPADVRVHPTPVYEMIAYLAIFGVLWSMRKRPHPDGAILWWYFVLAGIARFVVEFWRTNTHVAFGLSAAQLFSVLMVAVGALALLWTRGTATVPARPLGHPARR
jgi:phosphatidylglycerol:prolipoprotein diacylglycerol transferase